MSVFLVCRAGQPATQLLEKSLSADSTSVTLDSLQPDTEYVVSLYPLFPRNSASPSILNARTCELTLCHIITTCLLQLCVLIENVRNADSDPLWLWCIQQVSVCSRSVRLEAVQQLSVETESEGSVRVRWRQVGGVRAYRLVWGPFTGQDAASIYRQLCFLFFFS